MAFTLALRNLVHDKIRLAVTLTGVIFAVVLISVQIGIFIGFTRTISGVIDNSGADIWIASKGLKNFDIALPMDERKVYRTLSVPDVEKAAKFIVQFANWKKPRGGQESIQIVGFETRSGLGGPWNVIQGSLGALDIEDTVFVDELYLDRLGLEGVGETAEINDRRARIAGMTRGIRSFTTSPFVFASFKNALQYSTVAEDQTIYILVKAREGADLEDLKGRLAVAVGDVDVFTTAEFSALTQHYWMFSTGAGVALLLAAGLGLVVGMVVVAQTLYATTMDHLPEFATLKAMGAPNSYIYRIITLQAALSAVVGYSAGMALSLAAARASRHGDALVLIPFEFAAAMFAVTLARCLGASFISINKVTRIDPLVVFKGR